MLNPKTINLKKNELINDKSQGSVFLRVVCTDCGNHHQIFLSDFNTLNGVEFEKGYSLECLRCEKKLAVMFKFPEIKVLMSTYSEGLEQLTC